jgi:hypothetical protein
MFAVAAGVYLPDMFDHFYLSRYYLYLASGFTVSHDARVSAALRAYALLFRRV